jgi:hypothetical protein
MGPRDVVPSRDPWQALHRATFDSRVDARSRRSNVYLIPHPEEIAMKKLVTTILSTALCATLFASAASASVLLIENFNYPAGGLVANSGGNWTNHSGAGTDITILPSFDVVGDMNSAPDDNRTFLAQSATAKTYACLRVMIQDPGGAPRNNYFFHFKDTGTFNFAARLFVAPQGSTFSFGIGSTGAMTAQWPTALLYDRYYYVTVSYDASTGVSELWVNPANELSPKVTATAGTTGFLLSAVALRESNSSGTGVLWKYQVDAIGVGTTFDDACGNATPTSGTTWGQVKTIYR